MPTYVEKPIITTIQADIKPDVANRFIHWQANFNAEIAGHSGFVSLEFSSPSGEKKSWLIVQRFLSAEAMQSWHDSDAYKDLLDELNNLVVENGLKEIPSVTEGIGSVTEVIVTEVNPEKQKAYQTWSAKIHRVEAAFPGFRGVYIQSPGSTKGRHWITLLQFDTMKNLDRWLQSPERKKMLAESKALISSLETHRVISPYAGWFASIASTGELPSVWKQTMLVLLVLFPIVMLELKILSPLTKNLDVSLATFIGNALSVSLIAFPMMPIAIKFLGWWLSARTRKVTVIGIFVLIVLYLCEIFLFWNFL